MSAVSCRSCGQRLTRADSGAWYHEGTGLIGWVDDPTDAAHRAIPDELDELVEETGR